MNFCIARRIELKNIRGTLRYPRPSFQFCWMRIFPWIKLSWHSCTMWDKLRSLNTFWQLLCEGLFSVNPKILYYSYAWSCSLCEGRTSFCTGLISRKLCRFLLMFSTGFTSLIVLLLFLLSFTFFVFMHGFWIYFIWQSFSRSTHLLMCLSLESCPLTLEFAVQWLSLHW